MRGKLSGSAVLGVAVCCLCRGLAGAAEVKSSVGRINGMRKLQLTSVNLGFKKGLDVAAQCGRGFWVVVRCSESRGFPMATATGSKIHHGCVRQPLGCSRAPEPMASHQLEASADAWELCSNCVGPGSLRGASALEATASTEKSIQAGKF